MHLSQLMADYQTDGPEAVFPEFLLTLPLTAVLSKADIDLRLKEMSHYAEASADHQRGYDARFDEFYFYISLYLNFAPPIVAMIGEQRKDLPQSIARLMTFVQQIHDVSYLNHGVNADQLLPVLIVLMTTLSLKDIENAKFFKRLADFETDFSDYFFIHIQAAAIRTQSLLASSKDKAIQVDFSTIGAISEKEPLTTKIKLPSSQTWMRILRNCSVGVLIMTSIMVLSGPIFIGFFTGGLSSLIGIQLSLALGGGLLLGGGGGFAAAKINKKTDFFTRHRNTLIKGALAGALLLGVGAVLAASLSSFGLPLMLSLFLMTSSLAIVGCPTIIATPITIGALAICLGTFGAGFGAAVTAASIKFSALIRRFLNRPTTANSASMHESELTPLLTSSTGTMIKQIGRASMSQTSAEVIAKKAPAQNCDHRLNPTPSVESPYLESNESLRRLNFA